MASQMSKGSSSDPWLSCKNCTFSTRNRTLMDRHKSRCDDSPVLSNTGKIVPSHHFHRNYTCQDCGFSTIKSKSFLYHRVEEHNVEMNIYPCDQCDYASKYKCKVIRHQQNIHDKASTMSELVPLKIPKRENPGATSSNTPTPANNGSAKLKRKGSVSDSGKKGSYSVGPSKRVLEANLNGDSPVAGSSSRLKYVEDVSEDGDKPMYKCKFCLYTNRFKWMVAKHLSNTHLRSKVYRCNECPFSTLKKNDFCVHRAVHSNQTVYVCSECTYRTTMRNNLERHKQNHKADAPVKCSMCSYSSTNDGAIQRHIQEHHPNDSENRALEEMLIAEIDAQKKLETSSLSNNDDDDDDDSDQEQPLNLSVRRKTGNGNNSDVDEKPLDLSMKSSPDGAESNEDDNDEEVDLQCGHCPYIAKWPSDLRRHMMVHTAERRFKCQFCFKTYKYRFDLNIHIRRTHRSQYAKGGAATLSSAKKDKEIAESTAKNNANKDDQAGEFPCRFCPYMGKYAAETQRHERLHTGEKPYHCLFCEYNSFWKGDMKRHLQRHHASHVPNDQLLYQLLEKTYQPGSLTGPLKRKANDSIDDGEDVKGVGNDDVSAQGYVPPPKSYSSGGKMRCHLCTFSTVTHAKYRNHLAIHENLKLFKCPHCGKRSNWNWDIRKHIKASHPDAEVDVIVLTEDDARATIKEYLMKQRYGPKSPIKSPPPKPVSPKPKVPPVTLKIPQPHIASLTSEKGMSKTAKALTRCRPFKCGVCGQRSNWKWDLLKHIRERHNQGSDKLIVLTEDEARATWPEPVLAPKKSEKKQQEVANIAAMDGDPPLTTNGKDPTDCKRFKCSVCMYRSNWRSDIVRHVRKKHKHQAKLEIMNYEEASSTLEEYNRLFGGKRRSYELPPGYKSPPGMYLKPSKRFNSEESKASYENKSAPGTKMWKCSKCNYRNADRSAVVKHLVSHSAKTEENVQPRPGKIRHRSHSAEDGGGTFPGKKFTCKLCNMESIWRSAMYRHIRDVHKRNDYQKVSTLTPKSSMSSPPANVAPEEEDEFIAEAAQEDDSPNKRNRCPICPYKTCKRSMLNMHMAYHKPQPGNKFKCTHCPYYVCARRLLHQHMRLHILNPHHKVKAKVDVNVTAVPVVSSPQKSGKSPHQGPRYPCEKCPYVAKARNDLLYHKQFHRPRAGAPFVCEICGYWATHRRILVQHDKVHTPEYSLANPRTGSPQKMALSQLLHSSPNKSDACEYYLSYDSMETNNLKQSLIASKVNNAKINPETLQPVEIVVNSEGKRVLASPPQSSDPNILNSYVVNKSGHILSNGSFRKMHRCRRCPYTNVRLANVKQHEDMHGLKGRENRNLLKCQFCDYYCGNKGLLSHHLKVHSKQYEPGRDTIMDVEVEQTDAMEVTDADSSQNAMHISHLLSPSLINSLMNADDQPANLPPNAGFFIRYDEKSGDHVLEQVRYKKWCCEKCPYATMKQKQFERHMQLHGSKQKYVCEYCDYSVPGYNLLLQHSRLHMLPNPNLLAVQSVSNLQHLPEVPADIAAATNFPPKKKKVPTATLR